ncbi:MAG: peptide ABC transporter substrate-binding protein [Opitutae bacterium]|nr:peptide ABC transporter substrate-binding protein [Opitutae bacterium]
MSAPRPKLCLPFFIICSLVFTGCGKRETMVEVGNRAQILHQGIATEPQDLDPHLLQFQSHFNVFMALSEGLVGYDPSDLHPVPGVAERWEVSPDGLAYTFHLRANAKWSNGDAVTAHDFVFSARRILSPGLGSPFRYYFDDVRGAKEFTAAAVPDISTVGIRALDDHTLRIELTHPAPSFLFLLGNWAWYPLHRGTLEKYGGVDRPYADWSRPGRLVGNGPYTLAEWKPGQVIVVKKNPRYWDAARVRLNEIHFHPIENADTEERAFRSGQLHITENVPGSKLREYAAQQRGPLVVAPIFATYAYVFNVTRPPFDDVRVRRAFSLALDRESIVASQVGSGIRPARSFVPPVGGYAGPDEAALRFDPAEARRLLAAAGYPEGRGFPAVELATNTSQLHREIAEVVQQLWRKNLGVPVAISLKEGKVFYQERIRKQYQLSRSSWFGDYPDPFAFLTLYLGDNGQNTTGYARPEYDRLALSAGQTLDEAARLSRYREAEAVLLRDAPVVPLFHETSRHLVHPAVQGRFPNLFNIHPYQGMWLETK